MTKRDAQFFRIKAAMADLIERCGGQKRAGGIVGVSQQMMSFVCQREHSALLSLPAKLALERDCGEPVVTRVEAELQGHRLERDGPMRPPAGDGPFDAHAAVMAEVADLCRSFSQAVSDGKYSNADSRAVGRELAELRRAIERFERVNAATQAGEA